LKEPLSDCPWGLQDKKHGLYFKRRPRGTRWKWWESWLRPGRLWQANATIPRKASEVRACKELEGHIFTIGSGNKGKDGDMLRTSMEKMATYIGTKFGDEAAQ
jgi:hypothetical protein